MWLTYEQCHRLLKMVDVLTAGDLDYFIASWDWKEDHTHTGINFLLGYMEGNIYAGMF